MTLTFAASGVAGAPSVVTQGVSPADFSLGSGGTCTAGSTYSAGQTCTVQVAFVPRFPGWRNGSVLIKSTDGHLLASMLLGGQATGALPRLSPGRIDTVAGDRSWVFAGDGGSAVGAPIFLPQGLAVDAAGNFFLSDSGNSRIRRVDAATGTISTVIGTGVPGYTPDGAQGTSTAISQPAGLALDGAGNLYFADSGNGLVRRLDAVSGQVRTVAGTPGVQGYTGDGSLATASTLSLPQGIALDGNGNLLIADTGNNVLRAVDAATLHISTFAGTGLAGFSGDGGLATNARLNSPWSLVASADGTILFADFSNDRVRKISAAGMITTVAGTGVRGFSGDGASAAQAELDEPTALAVDPAGDLYIADSGNNRVRMVSTAGVIQTLAGNSGDSFNGDGGPSDQASLYGPYALYFDASANLFVADMFHNRVRRISAQNVILNFATIRVSKKSAPLSQGIANAGNDALTLSAPTLLHAALDPATSSCLSVSVPAGGSCNLGVEFAPTVIGTLVQGGVTVNSNAAGITPVIVVQGQVLSVEPTSTTLTASANPALIGSTLILTATVASDDTSRSGDVSFLDGQTVLCTSALNASGKAQCSTAALGLGTHGITANYAGDANNASSASRVLNVVVKDAPQVVLEVSPNPVTVTQSMQLKVTASGPDGVPTGAISFYDGANVVATGTLNGAGIASITSTQFTPGTHALTVQYAGDATYAEAGSNVVNAIVSQASTSTTLSSSNAAITVGEAADLTAQVSSLSGPTPTGSVTFAEGATILGSVLLDAGSRATLTLNSLTSGNTPHHGRLQWGHEQHDEYIGRVRASRSADCHRHVADH